MIFAVENRQNFCFLESTDFLTKLTFGLFLNFTRDKNAIFMFGELIQNEKCITYFGTNQLSFLFICSVETQNVFQILRL